MSQETIEKATWVLLVLSFVLTGMNAFALSGLQTQAIAGGQLSNQGNPTGLVSGNSSSVASLSALPKGTPAVYGAELGVSFDQVSANNPSLADATIKKLSALDNSIQLSGDNLTRYIRITNQISCEYCCGAAAITNAQGKAACGCAHSFAMRGLAKYLITNHGSQFTDDQILEELGKWKSLFFPGKTESKAAALEAKGIEFNYVNLMSNKYRGIETGQTSGSNMVGGC